LALLAGTLSSAALSAAGLPLLAMLVHGIALSRCMLAIEAPGHRLLVTLECSQPNLRGDAVTIRDSTNKAFAQLVALLRDLTGEMACASGKSAGPTQRMRDLVHGLNNTLVGIHSYAELLGLLLPGPGEETALLEPIVLAGKRAVALARLRASLPEMALAGTGEECTPECLGRLANAISGASIYPADGEGPVEGLAGETRDWGATIEALPEPDGAVLSELWRRIQAFPVPTSR
jgi:hypothetical protein